MSKSWMIGAMATLLASNATSVMYLSAFASESPAKAVSTSDSNSILTEYLKIQESLSADRFEGVATAASSIAQRAQKSGDKAIESAARKLSKAKNLKEARSQFKSLSGAMAKTVEKEKPEGVDVMYCPMAGAKWVQKSGEVKNPYFGSEMLGCGEKTA